MEQQFTNTSRQVSKRDRIIVAGGSDRTLDLLRFATIRSDDVVLIGRNCDAASRSYAQRFAIEVRMRELGDIDLAEADALLVAIGDVEAENDAVRAARRAGVPVHVANRELVSDFRLLAFLEQHPSTALAA